MKHHSPHQLQVRRRRVVRPASVSPDGLINTLRCCWMHSSDMRAHQTRDADDGWRCWLARHNLTERETRTRGNRSCTLWANDGWRWWLGQHTPIERETRTMGGGGGWDSTHPSNARREQWVEVVAGKAYTHRTRDVNDGWKWWLAQHTPIERETRTMG